MTTYRFYYNGVPINKSIFLSSVPKDWEENFDADGIYSWGYYKAIKNI